MNQLKPYSEYKDSRQPWLGNVPARWDLPRAKLLYREVDERSETGGETLCSVSHKTGVTPRKANVTMFMAESTVGYKVCRPDDLVINTLWAWMAALGVAREVGVVSPAYGVYRPRPGATLNPRYADLLLRTEQYKQEYIARSTGVNASRLRLYPEQFLQIPILLPPPDEQSAIVRFLSALDRRVNRFVRAKRRLIELLTEQKQAIITHAVTRGLDPNAKLKPSGIDWLGDVPEHWQVRKLGSLFKRSGSGTTPSGESYYGGDVPWVMTGDLNNTLVVATQRKVTRRAVEEVSALRVYPAGSLIVALYGATIGKTGVLNMDACTNQACCVLAEPLRNVRIGYVQRFVNTAKPQLVQKSYGGGQPNINSEIVRWLRVPLPPAEEQDTMLEWIDLRTDRIDAAMQQAVREIDLLREYRTRLVSDVVTGKLDVRAAAARLPEGETEPAAKPVDALSDDAAEAESDDNAELVDAAADELT